MKLLLDYSDIEEKSDEIQCKGLVFRGYRNSYYKDGKFELKQGIKLLKRKSCPGCEQCGYLLDDLKEFAGTDSLIIPDIKDFKEYSVRVTNIHTDWESGMVDDWDLEIFEI